MSPWKLFTVRILDTLSLGYFAFVCVLSLAKELVGENHWGVSLLLFVPGIVWSVPSAAMIVPTLIWRPILATLHILCIAVVMFVYCDFRWMRNAATGSSAIRILSNNLGEHKKDSLRAVLQSGTLDIIAFQEAAHYGREYAKMIPGYQLSAAGEYVLLSKFPITATGLLKSTLHGAERVLAARSTLTIHGKDVVLYNVHMPTPRRDFAPFLDGTQLLAEILAGDLVAIRLRIRGYERGLSYRVDCARELLQRMAAEEAPVIAVGDFNIPGQGVLYRSLASRFQDAFAIRGKGFGWTFPGDTENRLLHLVSPWLRLDYIFCSAQFRVLNCYTEGSWPTEHRAVVAQVTYL